MQGPPALTISTPGTIILTGACSLVSAYVKPKHKTGGQEMEKNWGNVFA